MTQINVNPPPPDGDRSGAAGINLLTVVIVLVVLAILAWAVFAGPLGGIFFSRTVNVNINATPAVQQVSPTVAAPQVKPTQ